MALLFKKYINEAWITVVHKYSVQLIATGNLNMLYRMWDAVFNYGSLIYFSTLVLKPGRCIVTQHFDRNRLLCDIDVFAEQSIFNMTYTINPAHMPVKLHTSIVYLIIQTNNVFTMRNYSQRAITEERVEQCYSVNIIEASLTYGFATQYQFTFANDRIVEYQKTNLTRSAVKSYIQVNIGHILITKVKEHRWIYFLRSPRQKNGGMEVHYYMRVTQNCGKNTQLEDYGMLRLSHDHRIIINQTMHRYRTEGDYRTFKLEPEPVVLDVWWPQHMYLIIQPNSIQCSEQVHYRIVSIQTTSALSSDNCSFEVLISLTFINNSKYLL